MTHLALKQETDEAQQHRLQTIQKSSQILLAIVNDILDFSKLEADKMVLERVPFQLQELFEHLESMFRHGVEEKGLRFVLDLAPDLPRSVRGDSLRLTQILMNLCGNAIKFTEQGEVRLEASVLSRQAGQVLLELRICDTGIGLSEEKIAQLFTAFSQADASTSRRYGGTGLGLAICKRLAETMRGTIRVCSRVGEGSCFILQLPLEEITGTRETPTDAAAEPTGGGWTHLPASADQQATTEGRNKHVLVAEDNPINQEVARGLLESAGYRVSLASDGNQVLEMLRRQPFDLVLMDVQMPDLDGYQTTREIRRQPDYAGLPVVAMTANAMAGDREKCLAAGMNDHLAKPIQVSELYATLERWLAPQSQRVQQTVAAPAPRHLQVEDGVQRFAGQRAVYLAALRTFAAQYAGVAEELQQKLEAQRMEDAQHLLHALVGVAGNLSAQELFRQCRQLEQILRRREDWQEALEQIRAEIAAVIAEASQLEPHIDSQAPDSRNQAAAPQDYLALLQALRARLQNHDYLSESDYGFVQALPLAVTGTEQQKKALIHSLQFFEYESSLQQVDELIARLSGFSGPAPHESASS